MASRITVISPSSLRHPRLLDCLRLRLTATMIFSKVTMARARKKFSWKAIIVTRLLKCSSRFQCLIWSKVCQKLTKLTRRQRMRALARGFRTTRNTPRTAITLWSYVTRRARTSSVLLNHVWPCLRKSHRWQLAVPQQITYTAIIIVLLWLTSLWNNPCKPPSSRRSCRVWERVRIVSLRSWNWKRRNLIVQVPIFKSVKPCSPPIQIIMVVLNNNSLMGRK